MTLLSLGTKHKKKNSGVLLQSILVPTIYFALSVAASFITGKTIGFKIGFKQGENKRQTRIDRAKITRLVVGKK